MLCVSAKLVVGIPIPIYNIQAIKDEVRWKTAQYTDSRWRSKNISAYNGC